MAMTTTDLRLSGMSCASCAARIERGLNELDGVNASVNFAVEQAHIEHGDHLSADDLIRAVEATGYHASVIDHSGHAGHGGHAGHEDHMAHDLPEEQLRSRLIGSAVLVETVFARQGIGAYMFNAVAQKDTFAVLGSVMFIGTVVCLVNLAVDLLQLLVDPRIRAAQLGGHAQ